MYLFAKWIHIVAIISWMAGILYLYRLFIYHVEYGVNNPEIEKLLTLMEKRLYQYITLPAMVVAWIAGLSMVILNTFFIHQQWFIVKFVSIIFLTLSTLYAGKIRASLLRKEINHSSKTLRFLNEVPTILMVIIVAMVVFRPV